MKVLLSNAPWYFVDARKGCGLLGCRAGSRWPHMRDYRGSMISRYQPFPFFLATASAMLKNDGVNTVIHDSIVIGESYNAFFNFVLNEYPDLIVFEVSTPSIDNDIKLSQEVKKLIPHIKILFAGLHAPLEDPAFLAANESIDYSIYGEYEHPLLLFVRAMDSGGKLDRVPNLVYRSSEGIVKTAREDLFPIEKFPWPDRQSLPTTYYDGCGGMPGKELQIITSRGCPFKCNFCVLPQIIYAGQSYRMRAPDDVINEILFNFQKTPYTHFYIDDDTININRNHFLELCRLIRESGLSRYPWACMGRGDLMDEEMLLAMKSAGCYSIKYGVESFDREVLARSGKALDLDKNIETIRRTEELGIKVHLTYCLGMLGDTTETVTNTIKQSLALRADSRQYSIATPFLGSRLWKEYHEQGLLCSDEYSQFDANHSAVVDRKELPAEELVRLKLEADRLNKQQILKNIPSQFRTYDFENRLLSSSHGEKRALVTGDARPPVLKKIASLVESSGLEVELLVQKNHMNDFCDFSESKLIPLTEFSYKEIEFTLRETEQRAYDEIIISIKAFNDEEIHPIINLLQRFSEQIIIVFGHAKIEVIQNQTNTEDEVQL